MIFRTLWSRGGPEVDQRWAKKSCGTTKGLFHVRVTSGDA